MATQPYYHRAVILFTATCPLGPAPITALFQAAVSRLPKKERADIIIESIVCEEADDEPGDPADL